MLVQVEYRSEDYLGLHGLNNSATNTQFVPYKLALDHALAILWPFPVPCAGASNSSRPAPC
jgi:hypothetical protein